MRYPQIIERSIHFLMKFPGVGRRTAERYVFDLLLRWKSDEIDQFQKILQQLQSEVESCPECGCLKDEKPCLFCSDVSRNKKILCVVGVSKDVFAIENTQEFFGSYHVLGGLLSPLDGRAEETLQIDKLKNRIEKQQVEELILAIDSSLEGDATCLFIKEALQSAKCSIVRLAFGLPIGSMLEHIDGGTLASAFCGRRPF